MTFYFTYTQKKLTGQPCLQAANFFAFNYDGCPVNFCHNDDDVVSFLELYNGEGPGSEKFSTS
jgi:hypothetical protein